MAILGYEVDVVRSTANGTESAPCYELYNHHYSGWMYSSKVEPRKAAGDAATEVTGPHGGPIPLWATIDAADEAELAGIPHVQVFSEGNGNEHRRSFKGAPLGYAQLIQSPATWANSPMVININKRLTGDASPGVVSTLQPSKSLAPPGGSYNGILECPCTTRIAKIATSYVLASGAIDQRPCAGQGAAVVETPTECREGALRAGLPSNTTVGTLRVINSTVVPPGCWLDATGALVFNNATAAAAAAAPEGAAARQHVCRDLSVNGGRFGEHAPQGNFHPSVCAPAPTSQLTAANNPICNFSWYGGGILCCGDGALLLDAHQPIPPAKDTWRLKYRCVRPRVHSYYLFVHGSTRLHELPMVLCV